MSEEKPPVVRTQVRVRYAETDQMGVAHHASYLVWFEAARSEFCRQQGYPYRDLERLGYTLPVVEIRCRYKMAAYYDDELTLEAAAASVRTRRIHFVYRALRGDTLLAEGETIHLVVAPGGAPRSLPPDIIALLRGESRPS
jgi:acyl-CoA thioester hydrolase